MFDLLQRQSRRAEAWELTAACGAIAASSTYVKIVILVRAPPPPHTNTLPARRVAHGRDDPKRGEAVVDYLGVLGQARGDSGNRMPAAGSSAFFSLGPVEEERRPVR